MVEGDRVKYVGASSSGLAGGHAQVSHASTSGYEQLFPSRSALGCGNNRRLSTGAL